MSKPKPKRRSELRPTRNKAAKQGRAGQTAALTKLKAATPAAVSRQQPQSLSKQGQDHDSKRARIIAMLQAPRGVTIEAMMRTTGWQRHSVRGFLAGVVRKKLGLNLISAAVEGGRIYRIAQEAPRPSTDAKALRAA
jgi:uncharacterized protein DUF3489